MTGLLTCWMQSVPVPFNFKKKFTLILVNKVWKKTIGAAYDIGDKVCTTSKPYGVDDDFVSKLRN